MRVGRKFASWGYNKYGVPGAVATGAAGVAGYVAVRSAAKRMVKKAEGERESDGGDSDGSSDDNRTEVAQDTQ